MKNLEYNPFSLHFVSKVLEQNHLHLSKKRGQNYLIDRNTAEKIIANISKDAALFEVGSGLGALTMLLIENHKTYSIEIDRGIYVVLKDFLSHPHLTMIHGDFLSYDFSQLKEENLFFVSNLPYSISGEAVKRFIEEKIFDEGIVMLQSDFVQRMKAMPGEENFGVMSILSHYYLEITPLFSVGRKCFFPAPSIDSMVVKLKKKLCDLPQEEFNSFLRKAFQSRRKTLSNNLKQAGISPEILAKSGIPLSIRPEEVEVEKWERLFWDL
jgi:16S rRNA (adenine1518-N6/adenine1519-N6)-dimethyltransferase